MFTPTSPQHVTYSENAGGSQHASTVLDANVDSSVAGMFFVDCRIHCCPQPSGCRWHVHSQLQAAPHIVLTFFCTDATLEYCSGNWVACSISSFNRFLQNTVSVQNTASVLARQRCAPYRSQGLVTGYRQDCKQYS